MCRRDPSPAEGRGRALRRATRGGSPSRGDSPCRPGPNDLPPADGALRPGRGRRRPQRPRHRRLPGARRASGRWCSSAATAWAAPASPGRAVARLQGLHRRLRDQPASAPRSSATSSSRATASRCCRATRRRSRRSPTAARCCSAPTWRSNQREIAKFSRARRRALPALRGDARADRPRLEPTLLETPPDPCSRRPGDLWRLARTGWRFLRLGQDGPRAVEILTGAARPILDRWFESEPLKATLATDAIIGAMASPSMPGTAYVLFHHVMGEVNGARGVWGYVRGGMGGLGRGARGGGARGGRGDPDRRPGGADPRPRRARPTGVVLADGTEIARAPGGLVRRRARTLLGLVGAEHLRRRWPRRSARSTTRARRSRSTSRSPSLPRFRPPRTRRRARPAAPRHDPHLAHARLPRAGLRRREVRPAVRGAHPRVHDPVGGRPDASRRRGSTSCRCSCSTRPTGWPRAPGTTRKEPFADRCVDAARPLRPRLRAPRCSTARCSRRSTSSAASASPAATSCRAR